jgi:citrate synthase
MANIIKKIKEQAFASYHMDKKTLDEQQIKFGLRNPNGTGVIAGVTSKGEVIGYEKTILPGGEIRKIPIPGKLLYAGYDAISLIRNYQKEGRFGFEEVTYLLLTGNLPDKNDLKEFSKIMRNMRVLPAKNASTAKSLNNDYMGMLQTSVSSLHNHDKNPNSMKKEDIIIQCMSIISKMPVLVAYNYNSKNKMKLLRPDSSLFAAENFLYLLKGRKPDAMEAGIFDAMMILLAEHGGGNNSTFTVRAVTSSGANSYMAISSGIASLSGYLHGGANEAVIKMMKKIKTEIKDWEDKEEIEECLTSLIKDGNTGGKIYGMGHAVYTLSDPRVEISKEFAYKLAMKNNKLKEFNLYKNVEETAPKVLFKEKNIMICPNVDFYSAFIFENLGIPQSLFTPVFAMSRVSGWAAHRMEEIAQGKLIRPAYLSLIKEEKEYIPLLKRK